MPYGAFGTPMMGQTGFGTMTGAAVTSKQPSATVSNPNASTSSMPAEPSTSQRSQPPMLVARPNEAPEGSSTPKRTDVPQYSPISPVSSDRSKCSTVVMNNLSANASSVLASSAGVLLSFDKDISQSSLPAGNNVTEIANPSGTALGVPMDSVEPDSRVPTNQIQDTINQIAPTAVNSEQLEDNNNNKVDIQNAQGSEETPAAIKPTFPDNLERQPPLSDNRRITLAYKYFPFPRRVVKDSKPVSDARGSDNDDDLVNTKPEDASENSFPVDSFITKSWAYQDKKFRENLKKGMIMGNQEKAERAAQGAEEADQEEEFCAYSSNFASILKTKPEKKQSAFHFNKARFAPNVELEADINKLRRDDTKEWEIRMKLPTSEIKNIQTAMCYNLQAQSHAFAFLKSSRAALNQVLVSLNPDEHAENIQTIRDVKQMLSGIVCCAEQTVRDAIYVHAGLTANIRTDFLKGQGNYLPIHTKQALLHESLGGTGLFDGQIHKYEADVLAHNAKLHQNKMDAAVVKSMQNRRSDSVPQYQSPLDNNGQQKFQTNSYDSKNGPKPKKFKSNQDSNTNQNGSANRGRGRGRGGGGGGANRGKKPRN